MEDLNSTLSSILGDPQKMEQLRQVAQSLGIDTGAPAQQSGQFNQQAQQTFQPQNATPPLGAAGGFNPAAFAGIAEVMKTFNQRDKNVELLQTLKPHFSPARAGKIDDAVRIMQIIRAWPALRDSGMLGSLGNMLGGGGAK